MADPGNTQVDRWQIQRQQAFKSLPAAGHSVAYLDKTFHVYPNTFWPFMDSEPLVRCLRVRRGDSVLDVGTGSGVIATFACYLGAARVLALDINPDAVQSARRNASEHGFGAVMEVRQSDLFAADGEEQFDVITANLPFRNTAAPDVVARSPWDSGFQTNTQFFQQVRRYLKPGGRIYFAHANFGAPAEVRRLAKAAGFTMRQMARSPDGDPEGRLFYAFLIK